MITIRNTQRRVRIAPLRVRHTLTRIRAAAGYTPWCVGLRVTTDAAVRALNRTYRCVDAPTDILSFANYAVRAPEAFPEGLCEDERDLGDLVVSAEYVARAAAKLGVPHAEHWERILIHGFVHLLGYDHATDEEHRVMTAREDSISATLRQAAAHGAA